jgi:hypothetical protein
MKTVKEKIDVRDQEEWYNELFNDRGNQNGNKLRTYRQFRINLHKSLTQEIRCLLTNDNQPISPRVEMFEVFFSNR